MEGGTFSLKKIKQNGSDGFDLAKGEGERELKRLWALTPYLDAQIAHTSYDYRNSINKMSYCVRFKYLLSIKSDLTCRCMCLQLNASPVYPLTGENSEPPWRTSASGRPTFHYVYVTASSHAFVYTYCQHDHDVLQTLRQFLEHKALSTRATTGDYSHRFRRLYSATIVASVDGA